MDNKNTFGAITLVVILFIFIVGGYITMRYFTRHESNFGSLTRSNVKTDLRIDKSKDYLYYENGEEFLEEAEIHKEDVVFNFNSLSDLNKQLHDEIEAMYGNVTKISDVTIPEGTEFRDNEKGYYSFEFREYKSTEFSDYVSLVIFDFKYDVVNGSRIDKLKSYVVDINTGNLLTNAELLEKFNMTEEQVLAAVQKRLDDTQVLDGDESVIDKDGTISLIKDNDYNSGVKALSISKNGKLTVNFIVKSNKINYNDSVEIN